MAFKIFCGIVAIVLMVVYSGAVVVKLREIPLGIVVLIGLVMMAWDLWDSMRERDD